MIEVTPLLPVAQKFGNGILVKHESGYLSHRPQLFYQAWHPDQAAQGIILIAHGLGGHSGQFMSTAEAWVSTGLAVYALDFRGHGRSDGPRGYIKRWTDYIQDLTQLVTRSHDHYPDLSTILWGHSLGGLIALDYILHDSSFFSGLILTAPAVGNTVISPFIFWLGRLLSTVWPRFTLDIGFDSRACSRDPEIVQHYNADPLHHSRGTARLSTEFQAAQARISTAVHQIETPTLILHGGGDRITSPKSSLQLYQSLTVSDRKLIQYPHGFHELHLDIHRDQVIRDMRHWIIEHCSSTQDKENEGR